MHRSIDNSITIESFKDFTTNIESPIPEVKKGNSKLEIIHEDSGVKNPKNTYSKFYSPIYSKTDNFNNFDDN